MYNIKQYTNFSNEIKNAEEVIQEVVAGGDIGIDEAKKKYAEGDTHYTANGEKKVTYKKITSSILKNNISKFGYCCEPKAIQYPIFLTVVSSKNPNQSKEFQIGKTGMFELQPEVWIDINDYEPEEQEANVIVTEIKIPWKFNEESENYQGYNFKLDFIYSIN